jgi:hypothetical protein
MMLPAPAVSDEKLKTGNRRFCQSRSEPLKPQLSNVWLTEPTNGTLTAQELPTAGGDVVRYLDIYAVAVPQYTVLVSLNENITCSRAFARPVEFAPCWPT